MSHDAAGDFCREDTIVAVSTPLGSGPRAILRLSGDRAVEIALAALTPDPPLQPTDTYRATSGCIRIECRGRAAMVPADLFVMRAPRSYTRDDVAELHVPGSPPVVQELMAILCRAGARAAGPGEFTRRAFLAGRLDLAQAEAVMAVISAGGQRSLSAAQRLLQGRLSDDVGTLVDRLRQLLARVELAIDFSQDDVPLVSPAEVADAVAGLRDDIVHLSRRSRDVTHLEGDLRVALVGRPNVGKSSLFNCLAGAERAIVTDTPGTTRDELRESFSLAGSRFVLSDTAGLDDAVADLELPGDASADPDRAAQRRTLAALAEAELVLVVVEARRMRDDADVRSDVTRLLETVAAPAILVVNKCDLLPETDAAAARARSPLEGCHGLAKPGHDDLAKTCHGLTASDHGTLLSDVSGDSRVVMTSALTGQGIDALREAIVETLHLGQLDRSADAPAVAARHRQCMERAAESLERAVGLCGGATLSEELVALELREALDAVSSITGAGTPQDVLSEIFAGFCIGK
jgi:tRNA modification GTPase